jgi:Flp pilus assembly pilin Flp
MQWFSMRFMSDDSGGTAIEYALIASCISLALIVVLQNNGVALATTFGLLNSALGNGWSVIAIP